MESAKSKEERDVYSLPITNATIDKNRKNEIIK